MRIYFSEITFDQIFTVFHITSENLRFEFLWQMSRENQYWVVLENCCFLKRVVYS